MQTTSKVLMVKPARFAFNPQTGGNNAFSRPGRESSAQENALREFTSYVALLRANKIDVVIAEDTPHPHTPDSIFPNNWFSTHGDGTLVLYPMSAPNRRNERKPEVLEVIRKNFEVRRLIDLTWWENDNLFLEGTGSMVLDRDNKIVYACKSYRTSEQVLADFCKQMSYTPVFFEAYDRNGVAVYHTNVLMSLVSSAPSPSARRTGRGSWPPSPAAAGRSWTSHLTSWRASPAICSSSAAPPAAPSS